MGVELRLEDWGCGMLVATATREAEAEEEVAAAGGGVECKGFWEETTSCVPSEGPSAFMGRLVPCWGCCCCCCCCCCGC